MTYNDLLDRQLVVLQEKYEQTVRAIQTFKTTFPDFLAKTGLPEPEPLVTPGQIHLGLPVVWWRHDVTVHRTPPLSEIVGSVRIELIVMRSGLDCEIRDPRNPRQPKHLSMMSQDYTAPQQFVNAVQELLMSHPFDNWETGFYAG